MRTDEWRFSHGLVEDFKPSLFDLSYQLQKDVGDHIPEDLAAECHRLLDDFNDRLQGAADRLEGSEAADYAWGYAFKEIFPYFMRSRFAERAYL